MIYNHAKILDAVVVATPAVVVVIVVVYLLSFQVSQAFLEDLWLHDHPRDRMTRKYLQCIH